MRRLPYQKPPTGVFVDRAHPMAQEMIGAWLFNEGAGTTAHDSSQYGNHGAATGVTWGRDNSGNAGLSFGGSAYIIIPNMVGITLGGRAACSGFAYVRRAATGTAHQLFATSITGTSAKVSSSVNASNVVAAGGRADTTDVFQQEVGTVAITSTTRWWTFGWTVNVGEDNVRMYVDGREEATAGTAAWTRTTWLANVGTRATIGAAPALSSGWNGDISFLYHWNRLLGPEEMLALHRDPFCMYRQPLRRRTFLLIEA